MCINNDHVITKLHTIDKKLVKNSSLQAKNLEIGVTGKNLKKSADLRQTIRKTINLPQAKYLGNRTVTGRK